MCMQPRRAEMKRACAQKDIQKLLLLEFSEGIVQGHGHMNFFHCESSRNVSSFDCYEIILHSF